MLPLLTHLSYIAATIRAARTRTSAHEQTRSCAQHQGDHNAPQGSSINEPSTWSKFTVIPGTKKIYAYP